MEMKVVLDPGAKMPTRAHDTDAGLDLFSRENINLYPGSSHTFDTGVHVEIPGGGDGFAYAGFVKSKSGLMVKYGILTDGVVDCGYSGSIRVCLFNFGREAVHIEAGQKIAQLVILPVSLPILTAVDSLGDTDRADGGFGSTGKF